MRITKRLVAILKKFHPLFINTHFNHPNEIKPEAAIACAFLQMVVSHSAVRRSY